MQKNKKVYTTTLNDRIKKDFCLKKTNKQKSNARKKHVMDTSSGPESLLHCEQSLPCIFKVHEGIFKYGELHGKGKVTLVGGEVCEGIFKYGELHKGKITLTDGEVHEGIFKDGEFHGKVKITFADGEVHEGILKNGEFHGKCKVTLVGGEVHEGIFKDGEFHGEAYTSDRNGNIMQRGVWREGVQTHIAVSPWKLSDGTMTVGMQNRENPEGSNFNITHKTRDFTKNNMALREEGRKEEMSKEEEAQWRKEHAQGKENNRGVRGGRM